MTVLAKPPPPSHPIVVKYVHTHKAHKNGVLEPQPSLSVVLENVPPLAKGTGHDWQAAAYTLGTQLLLTEDQVDAFHECLLQERREKTELQKALLAAAKREGYIQAHLNDQIEWRVKVHAILDSWWLHFLLPRNLKPLL